MTLDVSHAALRIVSWNVGRLYTPTGNNRLADSDIARACASLRALAPDVILLQEVATPAQLDRLDAQLPEYRSRMAEQCACDRHVAAFARASLKPSFDQYRLEPSGRGVVAVSFDVPGGRGAALAVHLDLRGQQNRRSQIEGIVAIAEKRPDRFVAVGGDFNLDPWWARRLSRVQDVQSFALFERAFEDVGRDVGATAMGLFRIDHFFVRRRPGQELRMHVARRLRLPLGDHLPIVLDARLDLDETLRESAPPSLQR